MALRSSKKIETEMPFGVGAVYKTSGFVESDIVESYESQNSEKAADLYKLQRESNVICLTISPQWK